MIVELHRKERIIFTAIDVINELGVQALSTKRIAALEGIAESTVFKHFNSKVDILLGVLEYYKKFDLDLSESLEVLSLKGLAGVRYLFENYLSYYENYPALTAITQGIDEMRYTKALEVIVDEISQFRQQSLCYLLKEARELDEIRLEVDIEILSELLLSSLIGSVRCWRSGNYQFKLVERGGLYLDYILKGVGN